MKGNNNDNTHRQRSFLLLLHLRPHSVCAGCCCCGCVPFCLSAHFTACPNIIPWWANTLVIWVFTLKHQTQCRKCPASQTQPSIAERKDWRTHVSTRDVENTATMCDISMSFMSAWYWWWRFFSLDVVIFFAIFPIGLGTQFNRPCVPTAIDHKSQFGTFVYGGHCNWVLVLIIALYPRIISANTVCQ